MKHKELRWGIEALILLTVAALGILLLRGGYRRYMRAVYPLKYEETVKTCSKKYGISPSLIYGVIYTESRFDPNAVSSADAKGLMQMTDDTYAWIRSRMGDDAPQPDNVFDPSVNLACGTRLLQELYKWYDITETVLAAYNAGTGNVSRWLKDSAYSADGKTLDTIPFAETRHYVKKVLKVQKMYQTLYEMD